MKKQFILLGALIMSFMAILSVPPIEMSFAQQMGYCEMGMPVTLNPLFMEDSISFRFADLLYSRLWGKDIYNDPQPHLLDSLNPLEAIDSEGFSIRSNERENGLKYTFRLKNNIRWHPQAGRSSYKFTATDVAFTFRMIKQSQYPTRYDHIKATIETIVALEHDNTIEVTLWRKAPKDIVLGNLHFYILPAHCFPPNQASISPEDDFGKKLIIGTGPYRFLKKVEGADAILLQQNRDYFQGWPEMEKPNRPIEYMKMQKVDDEAICIALIKVGGEIQLIPDTRPADWIQLATPELIGLLEYDARGYMAIAYNCSHPLFDDQKVRKAIAYAINPEEMLEAIYGKDIDKTKIISGPFPPGEGDEKIKTDREELVHLLLKELRPRFGIRGTDDTGDEGSATDNSIRRQVNAEVELLVRELKASGIPVTEESLRQRARESVFPKEEDKRVEKGKTIAQRIAKDLLETAGFRDTNGDGILDRNGQPFQFQLKTYVKRKDEKRVCERYQSQLAEIGVYVDIDYMEKEQWEQQVLKNQKFGATFIHWQFYETTDIVSELFTSNGPSNFVSYRNREVDRLVRENETENDPDKRIQNNSTLHRLLREECPYTFLFSVPKKYAVRKDTLFVTRVDPYYFFAHIPQWYLMRATSIPGDP